MSADRLARRSSGSRNSRWSNTPTTPPSPNDPADRTRQPHGFRRGQVHIRHALQRKLRQRLATADRQSRTPKPVRDRIQGCERHAWSHVDLPVADSPPRGSRLNQAVAHRSNLTAPDDSNRTTSDGTDRDPDLPGSRSPATPRTDLDRCKAACNRAVRGSSPLVGSTNPQVRAPVWAGRRLRRPRDVTQMSQAMAHRLFAAPASRPAPTFRLRSSGRHEHRSQSRRLELAHGATADHLGR